VSRLESDYYAFMGFGSDHARDALSHYLQFYSDGPVLELACGRGEFLDLLREAGIEARGVDVDEGMVQLATGRGHQVEHGDAVNYLEQVEPGSLGGVFCAHFLEHLQPDAVARIYRGAARALRPGGTFVAAVPSAATLSVLSYDFWRDPTHVRFYDPMLLAFFAGQAGLLVSAAGGNPRNDPGPPPLLFDQEFEPGPTLSSSVTALYEAVNKVYPAQWQQPQEPQPAGRRWMRRESNGAETAEPVVMIADPRAELWAQLVHVLSVLDERVQMVQHQYGELHRAYRALLAQLYPPNEVYVVAVAPAEGEQAAAPPVAELVVAETAGPEPGAAR
jgi:SAM-dependent methyltransferase